MQVVNLHKDPSGDSVFTPSGAHPSGNATVPMDTINGVIGGSNSDQVTEVISLRKKLAELEQELAQLKQVCTEFMQFMPLYYLIF